MVLRRRGSDTQKFSISTLETSAFQSLCGRQCTLSTPLTNQIFRSVISSVNLFPRSCEDLVISVVFIKTVKIHLETSPGYFLLWPENSRKPLWRLILRFLFVLGLKPHVFKTKCHHFLPIVARLYYLEQQKKRPMPQGRLSLFFLTFTTSPFINNCNWFFSLLVILWISSKNVLIECYIVWGNVSFLCNMPCTVCSLWLEWKC